MNKKYPQNKLDEAVMRVVACAGLDVVAADQKLADRELGMLVLILQRTFTDDPKAELVLEQEKREARLRDAIVIVNKEGEERHGIFIVSRLALLAHVDGKFDSEGENSVIMDIAAKLALDSAIVRTIADEVAQEVATSGINSVTDSTRLPKRYPKNKLDEAVMRVVACAGWDVLDIDKGVDKLERETLRLKLYKLFTDDPEAEFVTNREEREIRLRDAIAIINSEGKDEHKYFVVDHLTQLAFADDLSVAAENAVIADVALKFGLSRV